jgi:hypothetical protein
MLGPSYTHSSVADCLWNQMRNHPVLGAGGAAQQLVIMPVAYVYRILLADDERHRAVAEKVRFLFQNSFFLRRQPFSMELGAVSGGEWLSPRIGARSRHHDKDKARKSVLRWRISKMNCQLSNCSARVARNTTNGWLVPLPEPASDFSL